MHSNDDRECGQGNHSPDCEPMAEAPNAVPVDMIMDGAPDGLAPLTIPQAGAPARSDGPVAKPNDHKQHAMQMDDIRKRLYRAVADRFTIADGEHWKLCRRAIEALDAIEAHSKES